MEGGRWGMEGGWNEGNEGEDEEGGSEGERRGTRGTKARRRPCSVFCSFLDSPLSTLDLEPRDAPCIVHPSILQENGLLQPLQIPAHRYISQARNSQVNSSGWRSIAACLLVKSSARSAQCPSLDH